MVARTAFVTLAAAAIAVAQSPTRDFTVPRPAPTLNADPTDTSVLRLVGKHWDKIEDLPYKIDTTSTERGIQVGYNICNSTTAGPESMCVTMQVNSIEDFCLYVPPTMMEVGNAEAGMVAMCSKDHGARRFPANTFLSVKTFTTPSYFAMAGRLNPLAVNIPTGDSGGELDSGGQDQRGNPIGASVWSNNLPFSKGTLTHGRVWHQFIGDNEFCIKVCDTQAPNAMGLCEHVFDTQGCVINMPNEYEVGVFEACEGDDMAPVQPGVSAIPASSNCVTHTSSVLFAGAPANTNVPSATPSATGGAPSGSASKSTTRANPTGSGAAPSGTNKPDGAATLGWSAAAVVLPIFAVLVGAAYVA